MTEPILPNYPAYIKGVKRERLLAGLCILCAEPRGDDGNRYHCRPCAKKNSQTILAHKIKARANGLCSECYKPRDNPKSKWRCRRCSNRVYQVQKVTRGDAIREYYLKQKYGVSLADYNRMLAEQRGVCAICGDPPGKTRLAVDHCHATGLVRGLLCKSCNNGLGHFRDNKQFLQKALAYLTQSSS